MKRVLAIVVVLLFIGFIGIQFFAIDTTTKPVVSSETIEASIKVPPDVQNILARSCNDCHSNTTTYPWYAHVQPVGWFLGNHIADGRQHLNFSTFNTYSTAKKQQKLDQICEETEGHDMPLPSYLWIHWDAKMSDSDIKRLCDWAKMEQANITRD